MDQLTLHQPDEESPVGQWYVRVAVERGIDDLREDEQGLVYRATEPGIEVGERVLVPLRGARKPVGGLVMASGGAELLGEVDARAVKTIAQRVGAKLPEALVALARWMSAYYVCPLGMVGATMTPAAVKRGVGARTREMLRLAPDAHARVASGLHLTPAMRKAWEGIAAAGASITPEEPRMLASRLGLSSVGALRRLETAGVLERCEVEVVRSRSALEHFEEPAKVEGVPTLTDEQAAAVEGIASTVGTFGVHLVRGVTGSGKTEVYLRVIAGVLARGASALVLVPEIALTPQTCGRFEARFSREGVAVLHSGLSGAERHRQWARIARGEARVVVGARSAVFAPLAQLGAIVVDEEHDHSYKQDQLPRYNARDVAIKRGQIEGATVVLGSATPSLESWANATGHAARYRLWELKQRIGVARLPRVRIVDLTALPRVGHGSMGQVMLTISPVLREALGRTLRNGHQAILLLNRRGYASYVSCPSMSCGWRLTCESCDASMVLHRGSGLPRGQLVRCHHCLAEQNVPPLCPLCQKKTISLGTGTQRVEEELAREFGLVPGEDLLRVDADTMGSARAYFEALGRFARGEARVLAGTQMIAKGLDFPGVALVGVINADTALHLPDFRSSERTFQLVSQVAGRAGRGEVPGEVIVQTMTPEHPAIVHASRHDYVAFAREELAMRRASRLPPAMRMARIVVRDRDHDRAMAAARALADRLRERAAPTMRVLGPLVCPIARIADHARVGIEVFAPTPQELQGLLKTLRIEHRLVSDARTAIDVDPLMLM
ncbi:MAG: primosomal protein N' [Phycisphaeraceae bacterium]|nr:primosomal protein N' [Phycisphaeraceae bacterium]